MLCRTIFTAFSDKVHPLFNIVFLSVLSYFSFHCALKNPFCNFFLVNFLILKLCLILSCYLFSCIPFLFFLLLCYEGHCLIVSYDKSHPDPLLNIVCLSLLIYPLTVLFYLGTGLLYFILASCLFSCISLLFFFSLCSVGYP